MESPLWVQALTSEGGDKCEIGGLAREVSQVTYIREAAYGPKAYLCRYCGDFL